MRKNGFILLEIMLSLAILGLVLVIAIHTAAQCTRAAASSHTLNSAAILSQQLLTRINLNEFKGGISEGTWNDSRTTYSWTINKTGISDIENQYDIVIRWQEQGKERDTRLTTSRIEYKI